MHQEQEVYHRLYKDKLEKLVKEALAEQLPEPEEPSNNSDGDGESDPEDDSSSKGKDAEATSRKQIQVLRMKIRREVRAEAWENETEEVRCRVKKELMREREEVAEIDSEEVKVGLERSPESREL